MDDGSGDGASDGVFRKVRNWKHRNNALGGVTRGCAAEILADRGLCAPIDVKAAEPLVTDL